MSKLVFLLLSLVVLESFTFCEPVQLTVTNFEKSVSKGKTFVKFYTSWCGFCKKLAPTWDELSDELSGTEITVAKVNCEEQHPICDRFSVTSYPTLHFFEDGKYMKYDKSDRELSTLKDFALTAAPTTPLPADPSKQGIEWSQNSDIEYLTTQNFGQINSGDWLIAFYGEWCGFCKRMGPEYEKVATLLKDSGVHVAKADVDKLDRETKKAFEINSVPMIRFIKDGKMYNFTYRSQPAADFVDWVKEGYKSVEPSPIPFIKDKSRKVAATGATDPAKVIKQLPSWITDNVPSWVIEKVPVVVFDKALDAIEYVDRYFEENNLNKQEFFIGFGVGLFIFIMGFVSGRLTAPSHKPPVSSSKKTN